MRKRFGRQIDLTNAKELSQATKGNIAEILLTGHLMHVNGLMGRLQQRLGDDQTIIYEYLADEVLDKESPELQRFLLHTAVLPDMTPEICNQLLDITNAQDCLQELIRKDLFITQVGAGFRYHDLFTEFLRDKLAEDETRHRQVTIKAGKILAGQSRFEEAIYLYLSVQAWDETVELLETQGHFFYDTGRALTLNNWLEEIPEDELAQRPRLLLLRGRILLYDLGELELAMTLFQRAEAQFFNSDDTIGAAEAQIWQSDSWRMMGRAEEGLTLASTAIAKLETLKVDNHIMAWAIRNRGLLHWTAGDIAEALLDLRRALELFEKIGDTYNVGSCHHNMGVCLVAQGNVNGADHHYRQAIRIWEALGNANGLTNTLNSLGVSLQIIGRYEEAQQQFNESLEIALQIGAMRRAAFAQAGIGDTYLDLQEYEQAKEAFEKSTAFAQTAGVHSLEIYNMIKVGECFYYQHQLDEALNLANQARQLATETGLSFEQGLACALQAKIYVRQQKYPASYGLFAEALASFTENDVLEQIKVRLWSGYSLLLDLRTLAAAEQLQEAIKLISAREELLPGLGPTITETRQFLLHFRHRRDTPSNLRDNIRKLLGPKRQWVEVNQPSLQVFAFGPASLIVANEYKHFFSQRGKIRRMPEFLLYLILNGGEVGCRWSEVCAAIWPELDTERASLNFHQTMRRLRESLLGDHEYIVMQDDYYRINSDYLEWCDVLAFDTLFERAATASKPEALPLQLEIIAMYHGEFLAGFELEEWGMATRNRYEEQFLQTVTLTSDQLLQAGDNRQALSILQKGLERDYFREDLHRRAATAYIQLELFTDLSNHYEKLCKTFEEEFGTSLMPETQQVFEPWLTKK
jgi:tetratricopeptide (TPR) repeat protein